MAEAVVCLIVSGVTYIVTATAGRYFVENLKVKAPAVYSQWSLPDVNGILWWGWPNTKYLNYIFSRRWRVDLEGYPDFVRIGEVLFWLYSMFFVSIFFWIISWKV